MAMRCWGAAPVPERVVGESPAPDVDNDGETKENPEGETVPDSKAPDQIPLFDDDVGAGPAPSPKPWRGTPADSWSPESPPPASVMEHASLDLLQRNLEFLRAMELHAGNLAIPEVRQFRERHQDLIEYLVRHRVDGDHGSLGEAVAAVAELADLRLRILEQLDPEPLRKVMAAEPRIRIRDVEIEDALGMAELQLAEARGEVVEMEMPALPQPFDFPGLVGFHMVESLIQARMEGLQAEQEGRPLPPREGLGTLLRDLPVEWLDATWQALEPGPDRPRLRKERERTIAAHLDSHETLREVVAERLSEEGRRLLAFILDRGGKAPAAAVARVFGSDEDDGWFWNEEPPTSVLGQVRLHGLAFVGAAQTGHATRTVLVPRELRQGLEHALALAGTEMEAGEHDQEGTAPDLRPELVEALNAAFPLGIVEAGSPEPRIDAVEEDIHQELAGLKGTELLYRRTLEGKETWDPPKGFHLGEPGGDMGEGEGDEWKQEEEWEGEDDVGGYDPDRSYAIFFLSPPGEGFQFEIQGDFIDEGGQIYPTKGLGRMGWAAAVSELAPFALLRITSLDSEERIGLSRPDIQSRYVDADGMPLREDQLFLEMLGPEETALMDDLRRKMVRILEPLGITILSEEELEQPVPWLVADETILVAPGEEASLTVEDALFFQHFG